MDQRGMAEWSERATTPDWQDNPRAALTAAVDLLATALVRAND